MLYPYHKSMQVFYCPSSPEPSTSPPTTRHYGANTAIIVYPASAARISMAALITPASTYMMTDSGALRIDRSWTLTLASNNYYLPGAGIAGNPCNTTITNAKADCENGRHFDGVNVAFADGHVKWLKSSVLYAEAGKSNGAWSRNAQ